MVSRPVSAGSRMQGSRPSSAGSFASRDTHGLAAPKSYQPQARQMGPGARIIMQAEIARSHQMRRSNPNHLARLAHPSKRGGSAFSWRVPHQSLDSNPARDQVSAKQF
eukprot:gnl/MRDRNA2_/MRDRNA2_28720_c0_seq1.p1 gnl/MRDRNA2_/MRDRNA2_28720_c0~~gnl/MRDRNA2_/MRDRNA2_28720_c0_seq1.p1  ORF type:complete len:108 (+),score=10.39 gnl/MRDRNA2_/MRDRNA2_28720_c0_seq1:1-324(+)